MKRWRAIWATLSLLSAGPAAAWAMQGHMAVAAIAYDNLARSNPAAIRDIAQIMAAHPDHARFERNLAGLSGAARDRRMFEWMAQWPDDVRNTQWDRPKWHYELKVVSGLTEFPVTVGRAERALDHSLEAARDTKATPAHRALALCWLFHIAGDIHQPLHAGHRLSWRFPFTDRAGEIAWVRRTPGGEPVDLHHLWDTVPERPGDALAGADAVAAEAVALAPTVAQGSFAGWIAESRALAVRYVYRDGAMEATRDAKDASVLSSDYLAEAHRVSEVRIGQAGLRLAGLLKGI